MEHFIRSLVPNHSHPTEGELRACHDRQLGAEQQVRVEAHLAACRRCREQAELLSSRAESARKHLGGLEAPFLPLSPHLAHARLESYVSRKENPVMSNKLFSRKARPAWMALAVIAILAIAFTFQPVRALAIDFLGLFRVQQVAVVPFNPANLPSNLSNTQFNQLFSDSFKFEQVGEVQDASSAAQASQKAGFSLRLPSGLSGNPNLTVQPGGKARFHVDLPRIRALLKEIGRQDIVLPDELDGADVAAELPVSVTAVYGSCGYDARVARETGQDPDQQRSFWNPDCHILTQLPSPTISAPPGLDVSQIGKAFLMMTGMTAQQAEDFSRTIDWSTTLVIPIPDYASSQKVSVDGVEGVFVEQSQSQTNHPRYLLMWVKDGTLYALEGQGGLTDALAIAGSMK